MGLLYGRAGRLSGLTAENGGSRPGQYHTETIVLTAAHSGLTIQNDAGAEAIVSGAVPVANTLSKWSVVNEATNTWKLDTKGQNLPTEYGMRVGRGSG